MTKQKRPQRSDQKALQWVVCPKIAVAAFHASLEPHFGAVTPITTNMTTGEYVFFFHKMRARDRQTDPYTHTHRERERWLRIL